MGDPARTRSVYDEFLAVPSNMIAEIINGVLETQARPASRHASVSSMLGAELNGPFRRGRGGPGGWLILDEPELHLGKHILVPDLAGWRRERMPELPDVAFFELAPDWICEVVSPSTEARDRAAKLPIYATHEVKHAWIVDPLTQTLEVFRLESGRWSLLGVHVDNALVRAEPFDAVELELGALWAR